MAVAKEDSKDHVSSQEKAEEKEAKSSGLECYMVGCSFESTCTIAFAEFGCSVFFHTRTAPAGCSMPSQPWPPLQQALLYRSWTSYLANS